MLSTSSCGDGMTWVPYSSPTRFAAVAPASTARSKVDAEEISDADENSDLNELSQENELEEREYHAEIITEQN